MIPFPANRILNFHLQNFQLRSALLDEVIDFIKLNQDFGKYCMVVLDEVTVKSGLNYCIQSEKRTITLSILSGNKIHFLADNPHLPNNIK